MNFLLFTTIFSLFAVIYFIVGWFASRGVKTEFDYFLADKNLGLWSVTFTLIATQLGSGMLLGTPQDAYKVGFYGVFYILGMCLGLIILACGFAAKLQALHVATTAEIFETRYRSQFLKQVASLLSIITMGGILIAQVVAIKSVLSSIGMSHEGLLIAFWLVVVGYTMIGGLRAVVMTDIFQVIFILIIFIGLFIYHIFYEQTGWFATIMQAHKQGIFEGKFLSYDRIFPIIITTSLFSLIEQDLAQRFFASKSRRVALLSSFFASIGLLGFAFIPLYYGIKARLLGINVVEGLSPLILFLQNHVGDVVFSLAMCGIIAAITSTADSLLCAISSNVAQDFDFSFLPMKKLRMSQLVTLIIGILALVGSYVVPNNIIEIITSSYLLMVSTLFVPIIYVFFKEKVYQRAAWYSIVFGAIAFVITKIVPCGILGSFIPLFCSFLGYQMGEYVALKKEKLR